MAFAKFMAGPAGRLLRIAVGVVVIALALTLVQGPLSYLLIALGVVFILVGALNVCLIAPLIGAPFSGKDARVK